MRIIKGIFSLRVKGNSKQTIFLTNFEKDYFKRAAPFNFTLFSAFAIVDAYILQSSIIMFLILRTLCGVASFTVFHLTRGRLDYFLRATINFLPFALYLQYIMIKNDLILTPYFLGVILIMFPYTMFTPHKLSHALLSLTIIFSPTIGYLFSHLHSNSNHPQMVLAALMLAGSIFLLSLNSSIFQKAALKLIDEKLLLKVHLKNRNQEVQNKVNELSKRKSFEMQFSPQVVASILSGKQTNLEMVHRSLSITIFDIVSSTKKSATLKTDDYKFVVEDVFDLIGSICMKWNLTLDKFTGDGAQTFAGAPMGFEDDFYRSIKASTEIFEQVHVKNNEWRHYWRDPVMLRVGICYGEALVGFMGRGTVRSYTAIGPNVSLAHRLCSLSQPNEISIYSKNDDIVVFQLESLSQAYTSSYVNSLKGFEDANLKVFTIEERHDQSVNVNCPLCATQLIILEDQRGLPKVVCPKCSEKTRIAA